MAAPTKGPQHPASFMSQIWEFFESSAIAASITARQRDFADSLSEAQSSAEGLSSASDPFFLFLHVKDWAGSHSLLQVGAQE